ncbi:MAG: L-ribulose-5-phosphate 3-epimerase [Firmicutes bacterium]|nr:L-ribulose-5-phosphate 3-epimerase [Bacillota bacterium]
MSIDYRLGLYEKSMPGDLSLREKLEHVRKAGFDYMELSIDETDQKLARLDWTMEEIRQLRADMEETGTPIHSICLSGHRKYPLGHPDPAVRERSLEIMRKAILLASRLGIRLIQLAGYDVYYEESTPDTRRFFEENLRESVLFAAEYGVVLAFETMETLFMNTVSKAMYYVDAVANPWLQVYPDVGNLTNAAYTVLKAKEADSSALAALVALDLECGRGHISAVHLKETIPDVFREVPFGTGHVDFPAAIRKALELGVRAFVCECWYVGSPTWEEDIAGVHAFMEGKFKEAITNG